MHALELTSEELIVLKAMVEQEAEAYRSCPDPIDLEAGSDANETVLSLVSKVRSLFHRRIPYNRKEGTRRDQ